MKKLSMTLGMLLVAISSFAGTYQSGFFLDNYCYGYRVNPAITSEKGFMSIALGSVTPSLASDIGLGSFIFKSPDGGLVTGLNSSISPNDFPGSLKKVNSLNFGLDYNLFSTGRWAKENVFTNFEINVKAGLSASLPKELFTFLKLGSSNETFNLSSLGANINAYAEIAYGRTRVFDKLTIGWRAKALVGVANGGLKVNNAAVTINRNEVSYNIDADIYAAAKGLSVGSSISETTGRKIIDIEDIDFDPSAIRPSGIGAAIDLGATYTFFDKLTVSAAICDLGAISWKNNVFAHSAGEQGFYGVEGIDFNGNSIDEDLDEIIAELENLGEFVMEEPKGRSLQMIPMKANIGATMQLAKIFSVSYLGTFSLGTPANTWMDHRIGAAFTPIKWFSLAPNIGYGSFGPVWGGALAINLIGINIHAGFDGFIGPIAKLIPEDTEIPVLGYIPAPIKPFKSSGSIGITITFGERH